MAPEVVLLCESIHAVLALERALLAAGVRCDLAPTPRQLSSDCGLVVTLRAEDLARAEPVLARPGLRILGRYRFDGNGYVAWSRPEDTQRR